MAELEKRNETIEGALDSFSAGVQSVLKENGKTPFIKSGKPVALLRATGVISRHRYDTDAQCPCDERYGCGVSAERYDCYWRRVYGRITGYGSLLKMLFRWRSGEYGLSTNRQTTFIL